MARTETLRPASLAGNPLAASPRLRILFSPVEGIIRKEHRHTLPVGQTFLGRELGRGMDGIQLDTDRTLSAIHALIEVDELGHILLQDRGSKNGTSVNGKPVSASTPRLLADGDIIRMGHTFIILRHEPAAPLDAQIPGFLGLSPAMRGLRHRIQLLAQESEPVLIQGETGTGKEAVARALHQLSERPPHGEFVAINCSAIPENLAESELFGHEKNAFTGAAERLGCFRRAHKGTLLLDEIGDMPLEIQPKLLRVLQEKVIQPIGADREIRCNVRVVAATHHELQTDVEKGDFRRDLLERLGRFSLLLPPLRERREDILLFVDGEGAGKVPPPELIEELLLYEWPGNIREVQTVATQMRVEGITPAIVQRLRSRPELLSRQEPQVAGQARAPAPQSGQPRPYRLPLPEKETLVELLTRLKGNISHVAAELHCSRRQVKRWLDTYGIK